MEGLQRWLEGGGYFRNPSGCTGYYGPVTSAAVARWQQDSGLTPSGAFGPESLAAYRRGVRGQRGAGRGPAPDSGLTLQPQPPAPRSRGRGSGGAALQGGAPLPPAHWDGLGRLARGRGVAGFLFQAGAGFILMLAGSVVFRTLQLALRETGALRERRRQQELQDLERRALEAQKLKQRWKGSLEADRRGGAGPPPLPLDLPGDIASAPREAGGGDAPR